ncbi:MAG: hypothetical protein LBB59_09050 [Campylobacteraceae bacterium]|jgi:uncharacterized protein|nr:hypothetical protein [Campylobacteraceae bacterium]
MRKFLLVLGLGAAVLYSASFDCQKAKTEVEKLVCSDEKLADYQKEIEGQYNLLYEMSGKKIRE